MIDWLHNYLPTPVALDFGAFQIHWYGLLIGIGAALGVWRVLKLAKIYHFKKDKIINIIFYVIIFGLIFDRLYYVVYNWQYYQNNLWDIVKIWEGGLAIYGGFIGGMLAAWYWSKKYSYDFWRVCDILVPGLALALAFGRWGNYFNQELFGKPTDLPWGIPIDLSRRPENLASFEFFHPTFAYESLLVLFIFFILIGLHYLPKKLPSGIIAGLFFLGYSGVRIFTETLRVDYSPYILNLRVNFIGAVLIAIIALALLSYRVIYWRRQ